MINSQNNKRVFLTVMFVAILTIIVIGTSFAFFNYTRTGSANTVRTGRINFTSSQDGRINLTNIFPIDPTENGVMDDATKVGTVAITVTGDTSYDKGVEYLISATNVSNTVGTKNIPISISATTSGTLGTADEDYFDDRDTATSHIYKVLAKDTINNDDQLMVGYIAKNTTGINGTITIKAYIDKNNILISDTYPEGSTTINGVTYYNGTPTTNKTVFTTEEWNSLSSNGVSFQIKVEANEGIWVEEQLSRNDMVKFNGGSNTPLIFTTEQMQSVNEINFVRMSETMINTHTNLIDLSATNGTVKAWIENNKLYIASPGETYLPSNCSGLFANHFTNVTSINFNNVNTSEVTLMDGMFNGCSSLTTLDLSNMGSGVLLDVHNMLTGCINLTTINMSNFNLGNVTRFAPVNAMNNIGLFENLSNLTSINLSGVDTSNITNFNNMFKGCSSLTTLDLSSFDTSASDGVNGYAAYMFDGCTNLATIYVSNLWDMSNQPSSMPIFSGCTSLVGGAGTTYNSSYIDKTYAHVDGGQSNPGYLTLKTT